MLYKLKLILSAVTMILLFTAGGSCVPQQAAASPKRIANAFLDSVPDSMPLAPELKRASLLYQERKFDEAAAMYRTILEKAVATQDKLAQAWAHEGLAWTFDWKGNYPEARKESEQALALLQPAQNAVGIAYVTRHLGHIAYYMGDMQIAREHYRQAIAGFEALGMPREKAATLRNLDMTDVPEGDKLLQEAFAIAEQLGDKDLKASILQSQGDRLFRKGELDAAQDKYNQGVLLYQETGNQWALSYVLVSEGRVQRAHGHPEKALPLYQQALELQEKVGDSFGALQSTNAMAVAYDILKEPASAVRLYEKALAMAKDTGSPKLINFELGNLASAYIGLGKYQESVKILEELLTKGSDYNDRYRYRSLGVAYARLQRYQEAADAQSKAIEIARSSNDWDALPGALLERTADEEKLGKQTEALADAQETLRVYEEIRTHLVPTDFMKRGYSESTQAAYRLYVRLLENAGQPGHALEVAEDARARAFLDLLATRDLQVKAASQAQLASLRKAEAPLQAGGAAKANAQPGSLAGITMRGGSSEAARSSESADPELRSLVSVLPFSLPEVQTAARRLNSTVLSYWVAPDATYIWVVPADGMIHTAVVEVSQQRLEELIGSLGPGALAVKKDSDATHPNGKVAKAGETQPRKQPQQVGARGGTILMVGTNHRKNWRELYGLLIEPVEAWLPSRPGSLLTIEPHGPLLMLPFAALIDRHGRYLLERFSLHYTPAVSLLQFTEKKKQEAARLPPHYLLVADPSRMPRGSDEGPLPGLPGARREVAAVARLIPGREVTLLEGREAAEDQVAKVAAQSTVIHFATHGIIRDDQPFDSFLALGGSRTDKKLDGRLTAQKIYGLNLNADLVFLSACRSGVGKVSGDGLVGLTRAFWYAGTPSVIASLWDVADEPTYRLVANFYRSRLEGNDKSRALRSAQLRLLHELRAGRVTVHTPTSQVTLPEDPVFWASFVLQGEP